MNRPLNAIITGSTSGIGLRIAQALATEGVNVMINGFGDAFEIDQICTSLESTHNILANYSDADMSDPSQIRSMVSSANNAFGDIDVLVNNAGIQYVSKIEEFSEEKWNDIIAVNLSAAFHTIKETLPTMKKNRFGRIINIASAHGLVASPFKSAYVAAKHGIVGLTKTVALECAEHGVTANAICPGYVKTPLVEKQIPNTARERGLSEDQVVSDIMLANQPTKQFVGTDEISALAVYLCSEHARSITGASLQIDGGWTAH